MFPRPRPASSRPPRTALGFRRVGKSRLVAGSACPPAIAFLEQKIDALMARHAPPTAPARMGPARFPPNAAVFPRPSRRGHGSALLIRWSYYPPLNHVADSGPTFAGYAPLLYNRPPPPPPPDHSSKKSPLHSPAEHRDRWSLRRRMAAGARLDPQFHGRRSPQPSALVSSSILAWTPPRIFWSPGAFYRRNEYSKAGVPPMPCLLDGTGER